MPRSSYPIDIVIPWVNGQDESWQNKKAQYEPDNQLLNTKARYRDIGLLKYVFRSIEQYTPWVNHIYLLTDEQQPDFLNIHHPKVTIIDHRDFIPNEYLPTFNSNVIELNIHRIHELSEHFILLNDDVFFTQPLKPDDFFCGDHVVDACIFSPLFPRKTGIARSLANNISILNTYCSKRDMVKNNWTKIYNLKYGVRLIKNITMAPYRQYCGFYDHHVAIPYKKSVHRHVLNEIAHEEYIQTCQHKFRTEMDINHWLLRYWQFATGVFEPRRDKASGYFIMDQYDEIEKYLFKRSMKMLCINDTNEVSDFERQANQLLALLEKKFPHQSEFEK